MKSQIFEIRVDVTVKTGDYENEKVGFTARLLEGSNPLEAVEELKALAYGKNVVVPAKIETSVVVENAAPVVEEVKEKPAAIKVKKPVVKETAPVETKTEEVVEKPEPEVSPATDSEIKKTKKVKAANTPYDRQTDLHRKLLGEFLDSSFPDWKTSGSTKAVNASKEMVGIPFLDAEGLILESFKALFKQKMA